MKAQGNQPGNSGATGAADVQLANAALKAVTQELRGLQQSLIVQLAQDVARLQAEKARLTGDVDRLRAQQQQLQTQQLAALSQRQVAQQQLWAKRLAEALATHLEGAILQRMDQWAREQPRDGAVESVRGALPVDRATTNGLSNGLNDGLNDRAAHLLTSLDATLKTLRSLQQDFAIYEDTLPKQLNRLQDMEAQGKAILDALLARLDAEARRQVPIERFPESPTGYGAYPTSPYPPNPALPQPPVSHTPSNGATGQGAYPYPNTTSAEPSSPEWNNRQQSVAWQGNPQDLQLPPMLPQTIPPLGDRPTPAQATPTTTDARPPAMVQGIWLMVISTVALSIHNVLVSIIGFGGKLFGIAGLQVGPYINLVIGNSLLILLIRMIVVVPCLAIFAPQLYPRVWKDLERFLKSPNKIPLLTVIGSGAFLFVSQVLIYIAIAKIGPGVAVTILFMYPIFTVPLSWWILGDRPTVLRWSVMAAVALGVILTALPRLTLKTGSSTVDIGIAVASGVAFACYLISMSESFKKLHPVPVSLLQFTTILFLSAFSLWLPLPTEFKLQVPQGQWGGILVGTLLLGVLTLVGYLSNNLGMKILGPARGSIFSSAGPVMTAVLASVITPSPQSQLGFVQVVGILVVTLAVAALTQEKKPAKKPA